MAGIIKSRKFKETTTLILNDVAEIVLRWNLGKMTNDEANTKINKALAKKDYFR